VLQKLGFSPKPHPTKFSENKPGTVFDGLEKFQKANGLTVDGAVKNKDSEPGRALNKAMAEYYNPSVRKKAGGTQDGPEEAKLPPAPPEPPDESTEEKIERLLDERDDIADEIVDLREQMGNTNDHDLLGEIQEKLTDLFLRVGEITRELIELRSQ